MNKILHVCSDEKFIDFAIDNFNAIGDVKSDFIVITKAKSLKYIKNENVTIKSVFAFRMQILFSRLKEYDAVVFHSLNDAYLLFIKLLPKNLNVCWIGFGFDYYDYSKLINNYKVKKGIKYFIKQKILYLDSSYQRINYFCPVLENEFEEASTRLKLNAQYVHWNYGSSDKLIESLKDEYVSGDSILLGNSAAETNNHIEIIEKLIQLDEKREIIIPLSYGGNDEYISTVLNLLKASPLNYTILKDFMSQAEYFKILKRCSFVIMNHERQQALGNIVMMLSLGAKIVLKKQNPAYRYLIKLGFNLFEKESLADSLADKLYVNEVLHNKKLALSLFNSDLTRKKTQKLVKLLIA